MENLELSYQSQTYLEETRKWAKFLAIFRIYLPRTNGFNGAFFWHYYEYCYGQHVWRHDAS